METRTQTHIYLLGFTVTELVGPKLPSNHQVFGLFLHHHITEKLTIRNAATEVIEEVKKFRERARIPEETHSIASANLKNCSMNGKF